MPAEMANPPILPPQIFCNNDYLGDYDSFFMAKEMELSFSFFRQKPDSASREATLLSQYKEKNKPLPKFY